MAQDRVVICFCKHPEPGIVKSRLSADLGEESAAKIYKIILENTLRSVCVRAFEVALCCYPDINHSFFNYCKDKYDVTLHNQDGNDLGMRMYNAFNDHFSTKQHVVLIGSDCLELDSDYVNNAFMALDAGNDIVLGPSLDGGYALIGANKINISVFDNILWSTNKVLQQTKEKINKLGWRFSCMPLLRDIDTISDYEYFSEHEKFKHLFSQIDK